MFDEPLLINDHSKCIDTYTASKAFLEANKDMSKTIASYLWAYHEISDLIPQTATNFMSGHYFPYAESYYELESSYELALQGFYVYAFTALRSVLEIGLLGISFAVNDTEHLDVRPWITSQERTPNLGAIVRSLKQLSAYQEFDDLFGLSARTMKTFDDLGAFVHTRGYRHSSTALNQANFNRFSEQAFHIYFERLKEVVTHLIITFLLKYPVGICGLPLSEKFGFNDPCGLLENHQVELISSLLEPNELEWLLKMSENDPGVRAVINWVLGQPSLTSDDLQQQWTEWEEMVPSLGKLPASS